jgi:hypothetical protein
MPPQEPRMYESCPPESPTRVPAVDDDDYNQSTMVTDLEDDNDVDIDIVDEGHHSFLQAFMASQGPPQIVILIMLLALGFGSTVGVVSESTTPVLEYVIDTRECCTTQGSCSILAPQSINSILLPL